MPFSDAAFRLLAGGSAALQKTKKIEKYLLISA